MELVLISGGMNDDDSVKVIATGTTRVCNGDDGRANESDAYGDCDVEI
jgi:hypothetical protein